MCVLPVALKVNFFASMSHEIRTPLASLVGNIELVALGPLAAEQQARVRAMQVSAKGLLQVVNDVLDFSKIDVGELSLSEEWTSITDLLCRIASSYAHLATQQGLRFFTVFDRAIPTPLYFDPVRVSQIVTNLLSNAFKFTQSGKIVLRARWVELKLEISVVDSGIGIPDELKTRLFQPFTQGNSNRLTQAPKWQFNVSGQYIFPVSESLEVTARADYKWQSRVMFDIYNNPLNTQAAYGLLNASLGLGSSDKMWTLTGWIRNAFDKRYVSQGTTGSGANPFRTGSIGLPRMYGATLAFHF